MVYSEGNRGKLIALKTYIRKEERFQINNLRLHLKKLEREEQNKLKASRRMKRAQKSLVVKTGKQ